MAEAVSSAIPNLTQDDGLDGPGARRRQPLQRLSSDDVVPPLPSIPRRNSSFQNYRRESSAEGSRRSVQSSADSIFLPRPTDSKEEDQEPSLWHSAPLLFAILPAVGGVVFQKGSILLTDLALLVLAALYLNWCLVTPWIWYHSAQSVKVIDFDEQEPSLGPIDEAIGDEISSELPENDNTGSRRHGRPKPDTTLGSSDALKELRMHELTALSLCFMGPLLGSYILHLIRAQLSTLGDQLVSNLHLTLFVLGAEIRPLRYAMKMAQARTLYLQRVVREDPHANSETDKPTLHELSKRLDELETGFANKVAESDLHSNQQSTHNEESVKKFQSSMQTQIDALNRAVRRYEKRAATQTMQNEARLHDLDVRLKEAVSLAAAAASYSQRPGLILMFLSWLKSVIVVPIRTIYNAFLYPFQVIRTSIIQTALRVGVIQVSEGPPPPRANGNLKAQVENPTRKSRKAAAKDS